MDNQKDQIIERLKQANNVLVTVSSNPSVDQLAGAVGLTLLLNKMGKHATAVFSGEIPSTIEFLQPEQTLEKNTDSLRDFIIALDKTKADKLRYKVEDQMVKIFITPYRTSISDKDLEFSHGDFNVDVVMALGVNEQQDLDQAITAHGRILHDATVISVSTGVASSLGSINWSQPGSSSLCEMLLSLGLGLKADVLDAQMSTAFLTGIVAETDRFSNEKTSSETMQLSAKLMAAGANQQLVASQLEQPEPPVTEVSVDPMAQAETEEPAESTELDVELPSPAPTEPAEETPEPVAEPAPEPADGSLVIEHDDIPIDPDTETAESTDEPKEEPLEQIHIDDEGQLRSLADANKTDADNSVQSQAGLASSSRLVLQPPTLGGTLTANSNPEGLDPSTDPLGMQMGEPAPLLTHDSDTTVANNDLAPTLQSSPSIEDIISSTSASDESVAPPPAPSDSLSELEKEVDSPHLEQVPEASQPDDAPVEQVEDVNSARDAVMQAVSGVTPQVLEPVQALNAQPIDLNPVEPVASDTQGLPETSYDNATYNDSSQGSMIEPSPTLQPGLVPVNPGLPADNTATSVEDPTAPPPVPPPMMPPAMPMPDNPNSPNNMVL